jgi:acetyl esterase/lipase
MLARPTAAALALLVCAAASSLPLAPHREHEVTAQDVVVAVPGMDKVTVKKNVPYKRTEAGSLRLDVYYPPGYRAGSRVPAVIFVNGVGGRPREAGLKEWNIYVSWGRLVAASGWIGVTFDTRGPYLESGPDIADLLRFVRSPEGEKLGIEPDRIAAWVCSGNVTSGLKVLMEDSEPGLRAVVVYYGASDVAKPRTDVPVLLVRAGLDNERLNAAIDAMFGRAEAAGAPWTLVLAPKSHHAFDALDETDESRGIVRQTLAFFQEHLATPASPSPPSLARRALGHWFANEYPEAAADYGEYVGLHPDDATAWLRLGISQAHLQKTTEADASLQKAFTLGADAPIDLYNLACGYALLNQTDKALDYLDRAVAGGYGEKRRVAADEDLVSIRDLDRFKQILEKLP